MRRAEVNYLPPRLIAGITLAALTLTMILPMAHPVTGTESTSLPLSIINAEPDFDQNRGWSSGFTGPGASGVVSCLATYDSRLFAGGGGLVSSIGGVPVCRIAAWDGAEWKPMGQGFEWVGAAYKYGDNLIVGGGFDTIDGLEVHNVASYDGESWSALGTGVAGRGVLCLTEFQSNLIVGGVFDTAGGSPANNIAMWDGETWTALGDGLDGWVYSLAEYEGQLYAGGGFLTSGGREVPKLARWDGETWNCSIPSLGYGYSCIYALAVHDGDLYAGGTFSKVGDEPARGLARWDGEAWHPAGGLGTGTVRTIVTHGESLFVGGSFNWTIGEQQVSKFALLDRAGWKDMGMRSSGEAVHAIAAYGDYVFVGGEFKYAGGAWSENISYTDGEEWYQVEGGNGLDDIVRALTTYSNRLVAAGRFVWSGRERLRGIAAWDGTNWSHLGEGLLREDPDRRAEALAVTVFDDCLVVGGGFEIAGGIEAENIALWDGSSWSEMGGGVNGNVHALAAYGDCLVAGGEFTAAGYTDAIHVALWNGTTWAPLGGGLAGTVYALCVCRDTLYAGAGEGDISEGGWGRLHYWSGSQWIQVGPKLDSWVMALEVYEDMLIVGGAFTEVSSLETNRIAAWDGSTWHPLGEGLEGGACYCDPRYGCECETPCVRDLTVCNGDLVACGHFYRAGGEYEGHIARWNGMEWSGFGSGITMEWARAYAVHGYKGRLYAGGSFNRAGYKDSEMFAEWEDLFSRPVQFAAEVEDGSIVLIWTNPDTSAFAGTLIRFSTDEYPEWPDEGSPVQNGNQGRFEGEPGSTGSFHHQPGPQGARYYYSAFSYSAGGVYSHPFYLEVVFADEDAPDPPSSLTASAGHREAVLRWTNSTSPDATGTLVRYSTAGFPSSASDGLPVENGNDGMFDGGPGTSCAFTHQGLTPLTTYYYSAFAYDALDIHSGAVTDSVTAVDTEPPWRPKDFQAKLLSTTVELSWKNPDDEDFAGTVIKYTRTGYTNPDDGTPVPNRNQGRFEGVPGGEHSFQHAGLTVGERYYYSAFAYDIYGNYSDGAFKAVEVVDVWPPGLVIEVTQDADSTQLLEIRLTSDEPLEEESVCMTVGSTQVPLTPNGALTEYAGRYRISQPTDSATIEVSAADTLGNESFATRQISIAYMTSAAGGIVYGPDGLLTIDIPPGAMPQDAYVIAMTPLEYGDCPSPTFHSAAGEADLESAEPDCIISYTVSPDLPLDKGLAEVEIQYSLYGLSGETSDDHLYIYLDGTGALTSFVDPENQSVCCQIPRLSTLSLKAGSSGAGTIVDPSFMNVSRSAPNPFRESVMIVLETHAPHRLHLSVYDVLGRLVFSSPPLELGPGTHELVWDGRTNDDRSAPSGVYLLRVTSNRGSRTQKALLVR
jgi:hypothetical protein